MDEVRRPGEVGVALGRDAELSAHIVVLAESIGVFEGRMASTKSARRLERRSRRNVSAGSGPKSASKPRLTEDLSVEDEPLDLGRAIAGNFGPISAQKHARTARNLRNQAAHFRAAMTMHRSFRVCRSRARSPVPPCVGAARPDR
jgi:hypothetical protein